MTNTKAGFKPNITRKTYKSKINIKMGAMGKKDVTEKEGWTMKDIQENKFWKGLDR